ncbi:MAG: hypothetical protein WBB82_15815, partial [Limnothrix sp.]
SAIAQGATVPSTEKLAQSQVVAMATDAVSTTREDSLEGAIADNSLTSLSEVCFEGICTETFYTDLSLQASNSGERLYALTIMTEFAFGGAMEESEWEIGEHPTQVLCSTTRPMVIELASLSDPYSVHHISGGSPNTYSSTSLQELDALYWDVCHDLKDANTNDVRRLAGRLGYDLNREARTTEQDFLELIER